ncbi:hypothetical protein JAAARDRAFT_200590 [Jaapia argillacea MUCL 33604]|uniref:Stress-response A/B barrel domain-containing protein n=1 Tax=Jaapia argillacea MUCL 33604 TaxID=933084 RepID=A0A067PFF7_9AGAM|nr:hypothetical protein JAAARDRAFT_200590 [Jaapia argillacea MUCL 33604]
MSSGPVIHIVSFKYKNVDDAPEASRRFKALMTECKFHDGKPYILSLVAGSNNSPEEGSKGLEHTFIVTFPNLETRDYYLDVDVTHQEFKKYIGPLVEDKFKFDFIDGQLDIAK